MIEFKIQKRKFGFDGFNIISYNASGEEVTEATVYGNCKKIAIAIKNTLQKENPYE